MKPSPIDLRKSKHVWMILNARHVSDVLYVGGRVPTTIVARYEEVSFGLRFCSWRQQARRQGAAYVNRRRFACGLQHDVCLGAAASAFSHKGPRCRHAKTQDIYVKDNDHIIPNEASV